MTWKKYTEDLFDFETKDLEQKEFNLINTGKISFIYSESIYRYFQICTIILNIWFNNEKVDKLSHSEDLKIIKKNLLDENKGKILCQINSFESKN